MLKITHNSGFFSCCSVKLTKIIDFINLNKKLPDVVDSSEQFKNYKNNKNEDITFEYFENYKSLPELKFTEYIDYHWDHQFKIYSNLDYKAIIPVVRKYFSPSNKIKEIIYNIEKKYNLHYENICVLFYRGNDKNRETKKCSYSEYLIYANKVIEENPSVTFLIQSDEKEFIDYMTNQFPNKSFYFKEEIRYINKCDNTVDKIDLSKNFEFSKKYLAITIIMAKCKYIICGSGNCDIWIMFYRENCNNVFQNLNGKWYFNYI